MDRILFSATAYFPDHDTASRHGFGPDEVRRPSRATHLLVHLEHASIEEDDWRQRQERLDDSLRRAVESAELHSLGTDASVELVLRLGLHAETQLRFLLPSDLLGRWVGLGGAVAVDA